MTPVQAIAISMLLSHVPLPARPSEVWLGGGVRRPYDDLDEQMRKTPQDKWTPAMKERMAMDQRMSELYSKRPTSEGREER